MKMCLNLTQCNIEFSLNFHAQTLGLAVSDELIIIYSLKNNDNNKPTKRKITKNFIYKQT